MGEDSKRKILVVDDDKDILKVNRILLENGGYAVDTATSGDEALSRAADDDTLLIVLDITMPGLDAYALCDGLAADEATAGIPLLILADRDEPARKLLEKIRAVGDYITKPTQKEALLEKVRGLVGKPQAASENGAAASDGG